MVNTGTLTNNSGGLITYVSREILSKRRLDLVVPSIQTLWVELRCKTKKLLICNIYRPPNALVVFLENLSVSFGRALDENYEMILFRDVSENQLDDRSYKFKQVMLLNNL